MERVPLFGNDPNRTNIVLRCSTMVYIANDNLGLQKWDAICSDHEINKLLTV